MDWNTVNHYTCAAAERVAVYESLDVSNLHELMLRCFEPGTHLLDIGCGSGRDAAFLLAHGREVTAIDAAEGMLATAREMHPELTGRLIHVPFPLPESYRLPREEFDGVYAVAVLMHVPDEELFEFAFQIKSLLRSGGTVLLSFSTGRPELSDGRDLAGRLFLERAPGEIQLLFERLGFRVLAVSRNPDARNREIQWHTLVLKLTDGTGNGPVDQIETIIHRDRKDATYKLALLRALCDIAQTAYRQARWEPDDTVSVPLGLVVEKWLLYYWPIIEADLDHEGPGVAIPQKRGLEINKPVAFRHDLRALIAHCRDARGGLDAFYADFLSGELPGDTTALADIALNKIARTIVAGPVTYAGGALDDERPFFWKQGPISRKGRCHSSRTLTDTLGRICMRGEVWRELALVGHWISEAIILRWAELTHEISGKRVTVAETVDKLLVLPGTERDQRRVRDIYRRLPDLRCVWTETNIGSKRRFDVDHIIPYSLWHNNDLWNLMPVTPNANNAKRDKLVSRERLLRSRSLIIDYWQTTRRTAPARFQYELQRSLLGAFATKENWEIPAFNALAEAIESVAYQRGIPRWPECQNATVSFATSTKTVESHAETNCSIPREPRAPDLCVLSPDEVAGEEFKTVLPVVADLAAGGPYDGFRSRTLDAEDWVQVPSAYAKRDNFVVKVNGDSMEPTLSDGDYVICEWHRTPRMPGQVVIMGGFESGGTRGEFALKRFDESATHWLFHSDNPAVADPNPLSKVDMPDHPILGIAIYNLTQERRIR